MGPRATSHDRKSEVQDRSSRRPVFVPDERELMAFGLFRGTQLTPRLLRRATLLAMTRTEDRVDLRPLPHSPLLPLSFIAVSEQLMIHFVVANDCQASAGLIFAVVRRGEGQRRARDFHSPNRAQSHHIHCTRVIR